MATDSQDMIECAARNVIDIPTKQLDALIATEIFGLVPCQNECHIPGHHKYTPATGCFARPAFPTQGGESLSYSDENYMYVINEMRSSGWEWRANSLPQNAAHSFWSEFEEESSGNLGTGGAPTLGEAVCRAALSAIRSEKK